MWNSTLQLLARGNFECNRKKLENFTFLAISAENRLEHKWWWVWGTITISGVNHYRGYGCDKNRLKCRIKCFADESWYIPQNIHNNLIEIFFLFCKLIKCELEHIAESNARFKVACTRLTSCWVVFNHNHLQLIIFSFNYINLIVTNTNFITCGFNWFQWNIRPITMNWSGFCREIAVFGFWYCKKHFSMFPCISTRFKQFMIDQTAKCILWSVWNCFDGADKHNWDRATK